MDLSIRQSQKPVLKGKYKLISRIRTAALLKLPEYDFSRFVCEIESDPMFRTLFAPPDRNLKVVGYRIFPGTAASVRFLQLNDEANRDSTGIDIESFLLRHKDTVGKVRVIGAGKFEQYFLTDEASLPPAEIGRACGISEDDVSAIHGLVNELAVHGEFYFPSTLLSGGGVSYHKIAAVEQNGSDDLVIRFFSPKLAQGKYVIDYAKLDELKRQKRFSREQLPLINRLIGNLEMINTRRSTIFQVIQRVTERQRAFLLTGDERMLVPFTQKELAGEIGVDESIVSRAISFKSIEMPRRGEMSLSFFFPSEKDLRKYLIREIVQGETKPLSDREIMHILRERYRVSVSRRTVAVCRKESDIEVFTQRGAYGTHRD